MGESEKLRKTERTATPTGNNGSVTHESILLLLVFGDIVDKVNLQLMAESAPARTVRRAEGDAQRPHT